MYLSMCNHEHGPTGAQTFIIGARGLQLNYHDCINMNVFKEEVNFYSPSLSTL